MTDHNVVQIGLLLPDIMGTYGDSGNALVLAQRLRWRGIAAEIIRVGINEPIPDSLDIYTLGGAEDSAQQLATQHLRRYCGLQRAVDRGAPVLAICAGLQILGCWYQTVSGQQIRGLELLDITTIPQQKRAIGEVIVMPLLEGLTEPLTGFENHRSGSFLGKDARPLGTVQQGKGNSGCGDEGVVQQSVLATYLHGPCLARNPELADMLLTHVVGPLSALNLAEVDLLRQERLYRVS